MKKIRKIQLKKSDYLVLNDSESSLLRGGERTLLGCEPGIKNYECVNVESNCPSVFTHSCGGFDLTCSENFTTTTF
jgi:hypothetical protein